jgi:hypothetical protein
MVDGNEEHNCYPLYRIELFSPAVHLHLPHEFGAGEFPNRDTGGEWQIR